MSGDPYWGKVSLLLPMTGSNGSTSFTDASENTKTVAAQDGAQISTAQYKWSDSSGYFDGSGDYLVVTTSDDFNFGSGDMTIEFWFRSASTTDNTTLLNREWGGSPYSGGFTIQMRGGASGPLRVYMSDYSTGLALMTGTTTTHGDDNWHHVAWTKQGNVHRLFLDGTQESTATTTATFASVSKDISVGSDQTFGGRYFAGYIQDLRITKGAARYTENFTAPSESFPTTGMFLLNPAVFLPSSQAFNPSIFNG